MVLLYENNPDEVWNSNSQELQRRLYVITGLSYSPNNNGNDYGTITLIHHQDARLKSDIKPSKGAFRVNADFRSGIILYHTQFKALVKSVDFELNDLGEIRKIRND